MGRFEYHTRYLALRLPYISKITIYCIIALTIALSPASTGIINKPSPPWLHVPIDGQVDNIISDDRDGSVFIVANGDIYKYSNELKLLSTYPTSQATSYKITSNETNSTSNLVKNQVLLILKKNPDFLFSCWQIGDLSLKCFLSKVNEPKIAPLSWSSETKGFKTDPTDHIKVLASQSDSNDLLFVTSRSSPEIEVNSSQVPYLPAISRFKIIKHPKHLSLEQKSVLPYPSRLNEFNLLHDYVYSFNYNHHTHFILNDIRRPIINSSTKDGHYSVRLAKICNNDTDLTSYTEISLACNNKNNIYAKFAHFDSTKVDPTLYIVFEELDDMSSTVKKSSDKSTVCSYSMSLIDDFFYKAISDCNNGKQESILLAKLHKDSIPPPRCQRNPSNDWCTSRTNPYIDGSSSQYRINEDSYLSLNGITSVNFFHIAKQGPEMKDILFIGTVTGFLTKMSYDEDLFYTIDFNKIQVKNYQIGEKFKLKTVLDETNERRETKYSVNSQNIVAATSGGMINQLDIDACYYYTTCLACLTTRDPLECVWCGDTCSRKQDCDTGRQSTLSCPPVVRNILPNVGPISGNTKLRIEGENFGSPRGNLIVKLDEQDCLIDKEVSTSEVIECLNKRVDNPFNVSISVNVSDESGIIYSKGSTTAQNQFAYVKVQVYGLSPTSGPYWGETINVYGENLNAGSNRSVFIGDSECKVLEHQVDKISCLVRPISNTQANKSQTHKLKVLIDGHQQSLAPQVQLGNLKLSTSYVYKNIPPPFDGNSVIKVDGLHDPDRSSSVIFLVLAVLVAISILFIFLLRNGMIPRFKVKIPSAFQSSGDKISDAKVSFRNPHSHKFVHSNSNTATNSINGLVKLNGSVMSSDYFGKPDQIDQDQPLMHNLDKEMLSLLVQEKILIDRNRLTLGHVLGSGQFGRVYKGFLKVQETGEHAAVAVKTLHNRSSWDDALDNGAFLEEGLMMKDFEHDNVLALIGVTFDSSGFPMVITPFMLYGDLRSYISDEASSPTVKELIDFGTQVAKGMAYLSGLKFVHRDLAARNCMLDENLTVKVADFGLSRDIYERDYYSSDNKKTKLPVKWMAIESLEKCIYNTKTDVWSYGVLLWELMTRGVVPYPDVDNFDLFSYLKEGRRMLRPRYCPFILYKIMLSCWEENPANRPTFDELVQKVSDVISQLKIAKDGQQKVSRDITYCDVLK